ncbi:MAG: polysaccharide deacetylase family protein [Syntrophomonadaceae bacterium]|nr:polysaccharide deacetylase family protein [Syntrophomonadaceae bacterium]
MYFGSVRFFKHMILLLICIIILSLMTTTTVLIAKNNELKQRMVSNADQGSIAGESNLGRFNGSYAAAAEHMGLPYQKLYPDLYMHKSTKTAETAAVKTIYLTFDDGPSQHTSDILDILDRYNIKATFFVIYHDDENSKNNYREIVKRGHTIAVHSASHQYTEIYKSVEDFLADFDIIYNQIEKVTGVRPELFRFPGGSLNSYNFHIYQELIAEMLRRGFTYHDWNVSGGDADSNATRGSVYANVVENVKKHDKSVVLLHDSSNGVATLAALEDIIVDLQDSGYTFAKLDGSVMPFTFAYE